MSTQNPVDMYAEDNEMARLDRAYRAAVWDRSGTWPEQQARREAVKRQIRESRGADADRFIESIEWDIEHQREIDRGREALQALLDNAEKAVSEIPGALDELSRNHVYDVEIAEGDRPAMDAALTGVRMHLAALRHFTRNAKPEPQP